VATRYWERTWQERGQALELAYGETHPPGMVTSFSWNERPFRCPGACALCFPLAFEVRDPIRHRRDYWLYVTMGLSQPTSKWEVQEARAAGESHSGFGLECAMISPTQTDWATDALSTVS